MPRAKRVCPQAGCPELIEASETRCMQHRREHDKARGTKSERGYGADFRAARRDAAVLVRSGRATCWRCGDAVLPDADWHLDHTDDRTGIGGPSHSHCNLRAAGLASHGLAWSPIGGANRT